jgi:rod shape-determining protein MreD
VRIVRILLTALVILILQVTVVHSMEILGASPDLIIILLIALVMERGPVTAVIMGFCLGFLQDLGNASFLGMNALAKSIIAYGVSRFAQGFLPESILFKGFLIFAVSLVNDILVLIITTFSFIDILVGFFRFSLLSALYTALVGMAVLQLVKIATGRVVRPGARY